jgi:hypothetical protein
VPQTIQVPVVFEFRRTKVKWAALAARLTGWEKRDPSETRDYLKAEYEFRGKTETLRFRLDRLPPKERDRCAATMGKEDANSAIEEICTDLRPKVFVHEHPTSLSESNLVKNSQLADAEQLRDAFLHLKQSESDALAFLNEWGRWDSIRQHLWWADIFSLQQVVGDALVSDPAQWLGSRNSLWPTPNARCSEFPYFKVILDSCPRAIRTVTTVDLLKQKTFKVCARPDCAVPFSVESKHKRRYCSHSCAHLESVRRSRKAAADLKEVSAHAPGF